MVSGVVVWLPDGIRRFCHPQMEDDATFGMLELRTMDPPCSASRFPLSSVWYSAVKRQARKPDDGNFNVVLS